MNPEIIAVISTAIIIPIISFLTLWVKQHYATKKSNNDLAKKLEKLYNQTNTLIEVFDIYAQNNGIPPEIKKIISNKIKDMKSRD